MGFFEQPSGIILNGRDLSEFSCKLLTAFTMGAPEITSDTLQGRNRSTLLLLSQTCGPMEIRLPLEFWGKDRADTVEKWTDFCGAVLGPVELDLGDGFLYACAVTDLGRPAWITDSYLTADVTLRGFRQKPEVTITGDTDLGASVFCTSTFPRTDCTISIPRAVLGEAGVVSVQLGAEQWFLSGPFTGEEDLVLDGQNKIFLLGGRNVTGEMTWSDFPYLVPGENPVGIYVDGIGITRGIELSYRPTFL